MLADVSPLVRSLNTKRVLPSPDDVRGPRTVLAAVTIGDCAARPGGGGGSRREVLVLGRDSTVGQAVEALGEAGVLSAPIIDAATGDYHGFVSLADVVSWLVRGLFPTLLSPSLVRASSFCPPQGCCFVAPSSF